MITSLKFKDYPSWPPESVKNLVEKESGVFVLRGQNYTSTYTFSSDWKICKIVSKIVNKNDNKKSQTFEITVEVEEIKFGE